MEWTKKEKLEASVNCHVGRFEAHGDVWTLTTKHGQPVVYWVGGTHYLPGCCRKCYMRRSNERGKQVYLSFTRPRVESNEMRPKLIIIPASVVKEVFEDE